MPEIGDKVYRYEDGRVTGVPVLHELTVVGETPCFWKIGHPQDFISQVIRTGEPLRILKDTPRARYRFSKESAMDSYIARKKNQLQLLCVQLQKTRARYTTACELTEDDCASADAIVARVSAGLYLSGHWTATGGGK